MLCKRKFMHKDLLISCVSSLKSINLWPDATKFSSSSIFSIFVLIVVSKTNIVGSPLLSFRNYSSFLRIRFYNCNKVRWCFLGFYKTWNFCCNHALLFIWEATVPWLQYCSSNGHSYSWSISLNFNITHVIFICFWQECTLSSLNVINQQNVKHCNFLFCCFTYFLVQVYLLNMV